MNSKKIKISILAGIIVCCSNISAFSQTVITDGKTKIDVNGANVKISTGENTPKSKSGNTIYISGNDANTAYYDANGKNVEISGNDNIINLSGNAIKITVSGNNNKVTANAAVRISALGNDNSVLYRNLINSKKPVISILGNDNSVVKDN